MWILDYLDDIDADFRAFYRFPADTSMPGIADGYFGNFTGPRFFRMAERVAAFSGVLAARAASEREKAEAEGNPRQRKTGDKSAPRGDDGGKKHISLHQLMLLDPSLIQYEKG